MVKLTNLNLKPGESEERLYALAAERLGVRARDIIISTPDSKVKVAAVTTNEELVIASDTFRLLKKRSE